jgi:hypothetical protein
VRSRKLLCLAGIDLTIAEAHLQTWLAAETAVTKGQSFSYGGGTLTRAHLGAIREQIKFWNEQVRQLSETSRIRVQQAVLYG